MEEIENYLVSNNNSDISKDNETDYLENNADDTLTLTNIVEKEEKVNDNNDLKDIKVELEALKCKMANNENLLKEILSKIK